MNIGAGNWARDVQTGDIGLDPGRKIRGKIQEDLRPPSISYASEEFEWVRKSVNPFVTETLEMGEALYWK